MCALKSSGGTLSRQICNANLKKLYYSALQTKAVFWRAKVPPPTVRAEPEKSRPVKGAAYTRLGFKYQSSSLFRPSAITAASVFSCSSSCLTFMALMTLSGSRIPRMVSSSGW